MNDERSKEPIGVQQMIELGITDEAEWIRLELRHIPRNTDDGWLLHIARRRDNLTQDRRFIHDWKILDVWQTMKPQDEEPVPF